jgi:chorismate mutase-like protein
MTMEEAGQALTVCRDRIDEVDRRLLALLNERAGIVEKIGRIKAAAELPIYEPRREDEVFRNVAEHNKGPLPPDGAKRIFERIIDEMRRIQKDRMARAPEKPPEKPPEKEEACS